MAEQDAKQSQPQESGYAPAPEGSMLESMIRDAGLENTGASSEAMRRFLVALVGSGATAVRPQVLDARIAELDAAMSRQMDEILHDTTFQKIESAWQGLKFLVDRTDFRENIVIEILSVSKEDLLSDFQESPELVKSGLYNKAYTKNYGVFGGAPVGAIIANYEFDPGPQDMELLQSCAAVATMAHAPFIAAAGEKFFGVDTFERLPKLKDLAAIFKGAQYAKWRGFRDNPDSRNVGLTLPRFLSRLPYGPNTVPAKNFVYNETVKEHDDYLWSNAAFAFATRLSESFAKYRLAANIIGPQGGGAVLDLKLHTYEANGAFVNKPPTEVEIAERRDKELSDEGFMGLIWRKDEDNACFFVADSCQRAKTFGNTKEGKEAEANFRLGTQLPYNFVVSRFAHYLKVLQREQIGTRKSKVDLKAELEQWISQYVVDMDTAPPEVYARRPLRKAKIEVEDIPGNPGAYKVSMKLQPHFTLRELDIELSLVKEIGD